MRRFEIFEGITLTCPICHYPSEYPVKSAAAFKGLIEHCVIVHPNYDIKFGTETGLRRDLNGKDVIVELNLVWFQG